MSTRSLKHVGFHKDRTMVSRKNPIERAFCCAWIQENVFDKYNPLVSKLIPHCTNRDAIVSATIIQWLGSNVGQSFLCDVIESSKELQRTIADRCGSKIAKIKPL